MQIQRIHGCAGWHESLGQFSIGGNQPYLIRTVFDISNREDGSNWCGRSAVVCGEGF